MIQCDNGDGRTGFASWADGRKLCEQCFNEMGPDPRYTAEENEENKKRLAENRRLREERKRNPLTADERERANKLLDDIFGPQK